MDRLKRGWKFVASAGRRTSIYPALDPVLHVGLAWISIAMLVAGSLCTVDARAQAESTPPDVSNAARSAEQQNQLIEQQLRARERERTVHAPAVRSTVPEAGAYPTLPTETPCFRVDRFMLEVPATLPDAVKAQGASALPQDRFAFAHEWLTRYTGECIGKQGVDLIVKGLSQQILSRGYITTRVLLPEQNLSTGTLKLALVPGVIRHIRFADPTLYGTWKSAFPLATAMS